METDNISKLSAQEEKTLAQMKDWLYSGGALYESLQVVNFGEGYRGVISNTPIKKNQTLVFIPKSHLITLEIARQDSICQQLIQSKVEIISPKHTYLAIFLLQELIKQDKSYWRHYLSLLPKDHSNFPINYPNEQLLELVGSPFLMQIHEKVLDLKRDYDRIFMVSSNFKKYKFRDFCWARTIVGSRIFGVFINGIKTDILAPFADMLNHRLPKQTAWNYIDQKEGFVIQSLEDIPPKVQIFDSYGKKCNSRYLLNYGFVVPNNPDNQVCIKIEIDGPLKQKKLDMLKKTECLKILKVSCNLSDCTFYESMGLLRFKLLADINHLSVLQKISAIKITNQAYIATKTPPITIELECTIWNYLKKLCQDSLKQYSTTLEEDQKLLKNSQLAENIKNILILRSGQKKVLQQLIEYANQIIPILKQGFEKSYEYVIEQPQKPWTKYLLKILKIMPGQKSKLIADNVSIEVQEEQESRDAEQQLENN